jgi:hypothetical protein
VSFLLDTSILSEIRKGPRCHPGVARWFASIGEHEIYLSVLVVGEIRKGIELLRRKDRDAAVRLESWLQQVVHDYDERILPVDRTVAEEWGRLSVPNPLPTVDGLLAATAKVSHLVLATRNVDNIKTTGVRCVNPFDA